MDEPWLPEKARAGAWQLAQLVPWGSESVESKKIALPRAILDGFAGAALTWGSPGIAAGAAVTWGALAMDATSGMAASNA